MSLHQDEEYEITNHPMVEVSLKTDQSGFEAAVSEDGNEIENGNPLEDEKGGTLVDQGKGRKKLREKGVSFKLSILFEEKK